MPNDSTKKEAPPRSQSLIRMGQFIVFLIIQIPLLPLTIIGYIFAVVKALLYSKKYGMSATATNPLSARWFLHVLGKREDDTMVTMISSLPVLSTVGLWLIYGPAFIANRICGYTPHLARFLEPEKASLMSLHSCLLYILLLNYPPNSEKLDKSTFWLSYFRSILLQLYDTLQLCYT